MKTVIVHNVPHGAQVLIAKERNVFLSPGVYINNAMDGYRDVPDEDVIDKFIHRTTQKGSTLYFYFEENTYLRIRRQGFLSIDLHTSSIEENTKKLEMSPIPHLFKGAEWEHPGNNVFDLPLLGVDPANFGQDYTVEYDINVPVRNAPPPPIFPLEGTITLTDPGLTFTHGINLT